MARLRHLTARTLACLFAIAAGAFAAMAEGTLDQDNSPPWNGAVVNISPASRATQSFTPRFDCLTGIEVALMTVYRGRGGDQVTLIVQDGAKPLASSSAAIPEGFDGFWRFDFAPPLRVESGKLVTFEVADTGKSVVFWKHAPNDHYKSGHASFSGSPFYTNDFLFRTYGGPSTSPAAPCR